MRGEKGPLARFMEAREDGTVRMINPITGLEAWYVPGRAIRPITNAPEPEGRVFVPRDREDYCDFCEANYLNTPPEKERLVARDGALESIKAVSASAIAGTVAEFRRIPNLFEVVTYSYWAARHDHRLSRENATHMKAYLSEEAGRRHVDQIVAAKLKLSGRNANDLECLEASERSCLEEGLFGGSHDLIVARRHYSPGKGHRPDLCSSGELQSDQHFAYIRFTAEAIRDIHEQNSHVRYVMTFQNWLHAGGASFDHLHKQLVGFDAWGALLEREAVAARENPQIYNELIVDLARDQKRLIAENDYSVLLVDIGHRHPTLGIYSKSHNLRPWEHAPEELRGMSDLLHATHKAQGGALPCNEDWVYAPVGCDQRIPWHILLRWRVNNPSGFEGGTEFYLHPISPRQMAERLRSRLREIQEENQSNGFRIVSDSDGPSGSLRYLEGS